MQPKEPNREIQEQIFGKRYAGATTARISLPRGSDVKLLDFIKKPKGFVTIYGPPGTGKTYLAAAIVGENRSFGRTIRYFTERSYLGRIREGFEKYNAYDYIQEISRLCDASIFILDDFCSSEQNDWREEVLMETVDYLYRNEVPAIFISNNDKQRMSERTTPRISSRLFAKDNFIIDLTDSMDFRGETND